MKHLTIHESLDSFKGEKDNLLKPHVALIKGGDKPILGYAKAGSPFTAHEQGNAAFVDLDGGALTPHGGVVVEYDFTLNKKLGTGELYNALDTMYLDGQLYDIDNLIVDVVSGSGSASASGSGSGADIAGSISMPDNVTGIHKVEFCIGNAMFYAPRILKGCEVIGSPIIPTPNTVETCANGHEFVDLGLPSGRLWATCNVGANKRGEYGLYFQWAGTQGYPDESQKKFDWPAPYAQRGNNSSLQKYTGNDGLDELEVADDAARANMGGMWLMPSRRDFIELKKCCTWQWNGNDFEVVGPNGNFISLPVAGCAKVGYMEFQGQEGHYWSRNLYYNALCGCGLLITNRYDPHTSYSQQRCYGLSVRGVL